MRQHTKPGFVLIVCLMTLMFLGFMAVYVADKAGIFVPYADSLTDAKRAHVLASSGIQLGMSQLVAPQTGKKKDEQGQQKKLSAQDAALEQLTVILPTLNRWQSVELTEDRDGIEGTIQWCIVSEHGKIDINAWYDFAKHEIAGQKTGEALFKELFEKIQQMTGSKDLLPAFNKFMKDREYPLNDATELLMQPLSAFKDAIFYDPANFGQKQLYLTDIFTVWTGSKSINPWLLSASLQTLLGCSASTEDTAARKKMVAEWLKPFKLNAQWQTEWDKVIKPMYKKDFASIPKALQPLLGSEYEASVFSVYATATVGRVTERLMAIIVLQDGQEPILKKVYKL